MGVLLDPQVEIVKEENHELREKLAALEHEQWVQWAKSILESEDISKERADRWKKFFVPYDKLPEDAKDDDREWADNVLAIVEKGEVEEVENQRIVELEGMDSSSSKGAEWIPKKLLKPKKKKDVIRKP